MPTDIFNLHKKHLEKGMTSKSMCYGFVRGRVRVAVAGEGRVNHAVKFDLNLTSFGSLIWINQ